MTTQKNLHRRDSTISAGAVALVRQLVLLAFMYTGLPTETRAELPRTDLWTERSTDAWGGFGTTEGRIEVRSNTGQLVGNLATEIEIKPGDSPATVVLNLGKAWDVQDADQLVFAWRIMKGSIASSPSVTIWARNEIGEGYSRYRERSIRGKWAYARLDLTGPDEQDAQYGAASRRGVQRIEFTFPASDQVVHVLVDDLHFETSFALIQARSRALGPLVERIRPERYGAFLCGSHLDGKPDAQRELQRMYAPVEPPPVSPHRTWGKPLSGGPVRVLFVINLAFQREVVELAQRFDLDYDFVPLALVQRYQPEMMADILRNRYDVIYTSALKPDDQMAPFTGWLSQAVHEGAGWIAVNSGGRCGEIRLPFAAIDAERPVVDRWRTVEDHPILDGVPVDLLPSFESRVYDERREHGLPILRGEKGGAKLMVSRAGRGRIVNLAGGFGNSAFGIIPRPLSSEHVLHHFPYWEYEYALAANAILWAADRDPRASVRVRGPTRFSRESSASEIVVTAAAAEPVEGTIAFNLSGLDGEHELEETRDASLTPDTGSEFRLSLPRGIASGTHVLDTVFKDREGQVLDWHSEIIHVDGDVKIKEAAPDQEHYRRGDTMHIAVTAKNRGPARAGTLHYRVTDTFDRVVYQDSSPAAVPEGSATFEKTILLDPERFLAEIHWLKVSFADDTGTAAYTFRRLYTPVAPEEKHRRWWAGGTAGGTTQHPHIYRHMAAVIRAMHLKGIMTNGNYQHHQAELILDSDLWVTPENIIKMGHWNQRFPDGVRKPCLSDPEFLSKQIEQRAFEFAGTFRKFGPLGYATAEETSLSVSRPDGAVCTGPHCRREFVSWLQEIYPDLDSLNEQWDTTFAAWREVEPLRWEDGAAELENPSRWIDFRMFMEQVLANMQRRFNRGIHQGDPGAYVGFNCAPYGVNPFHGFNRPLLGRHTNFSIEYQPSWLEDRGVSSSMELLIDTAPHMKLSFWIGYNYMDLDPGRYWFKTWWFALRQQYGPTYFTLSNDASTVAHYSYMKLHPTLAFNGFSTLAKELTGSLTSGIGKQLLNCDRQVDIGIYFSRASMMRNYFERHRKPEASSLNVWDVRKLLREENFDYRRLTAHELLSGIASRYPLLILADTVALRAEEWDAFEQYVAKGGKIMAFAGAGIADGHGKVRLDSRRAADLLGVQYQGAVASWRPEKIERFDGKPVAGDVMARAPVDLQGGDVLAVFSDGSPAVVTRRLGKGTTLYCNFSDRIDSSKGNRGLISEMIGFAGLTPAVAVSANGENLGGFQSFRYRRGPIELIGLLHTLSSSVPAGTSLRVREAGRAHTYNVLSGADEGFGNEVSFIAPDRGRPALFARVPYAVEALEIVCPESANPGDVIYYTVTLHATDKTAGDHVFNVRVTDPEGREVDLLSRNMLSTEGRFEGALPFAYNAAPGAWSIEVRDVISGKRARHTIALQ